MNASTGARTILETCMGLRQGERLFVVFDPRHRSAAEKFETGAKAIGATFSMMKDLGGGREPSTEVSRAAMESDVTIFCVEEGKTLLYGHSDARAKACEAGGRIGFLTQKLDSVPDPGELLKIHERVDRIAHLLEASKSVVILSGSGTSRLESKIGRRVTRLSSILVDRGSWGAVPDYAEAAVAPFESESDGEFSVDGTVVGMGRVVSPIILKFVQGRLTSAAGGGFAGELAEKTRADDGASVLCEIGLGANHLRETLLGEFDDKKMLGSIHVGLGDNHTIGGTSRSSIHIDCLAKSPQVILDGRQVGLVGL